MPCSPAPTCVFDSYWRFAAERHAMYLRRLAGDAAPWTNDLILRKFRFTNTFRAADRVSQFLIGEVQYRDDRSQAPAEIFFRTLLFKIFNKISTWECLESDAGGISWQSADFNRFDVMLSDLMARGERIYSAAYIMPSPANGFDRKHRNHLKLLQNMMQDGLPAKIERASKLSDVYHLLLAYPGIGPFLAFQYTIDLNYSQMLEFDEDDFVVAGPGALDGIDKCFENSCELDPEAIIYEMAFSQAQHFDRLGLQFDGLFGRSLRPIDCQNIFCEISKYARVAHPEMKSRTNRTKIKQNYHSAELDLSDPTFPPRWGIAAPPRVRRVSNQSKIHQLQLWN